MDESHNTLPLIEDHVGEELSGGPCDREVRLEDVQELRRAVVEHRDSLRRLCGILMSQPGSANEEIQDVLDSVNKPFEWIK